MSKPPINLRRFTQAAHLIFVGYGHWLPNDLRGSGSSEIRKDELKQLGDIHFGRRIDQPSRDELRDFHQDAEPLLQHPVIWFDESMRQLIADVFAKVIRERGYTCWAFAVLRDHAHVLLRTHRDHSDEMLRRFAKESSRALRTANESFKDHPIWSARPYKVLIFSRSEVPPRVGYVNGNPKKHGLPPQTWEFVQRCPWV
jgi:REP element-mobilizing transposase RayT